MGVTGLLTLLRSIQKPTTLKNFSGQTLGVDAFGWLHRAVVACALELALDKPTTKYVDITVNRVRMLLDFGIQPYLVFDGDAVPSKADVNDERRRKREEAKALGLSMWKSGSTKADAYRELQKAAGVTPQMTRQLIEALKIMNVAYVVAPYEADAQLVYLEKQGIIDGILSEDSDLLVFGANRLITKLDQYGSCVEISRKDFYLCKEVSLAGFTDAMFRSMSILSGCDYLPNVNKMGLKTAHEYIRKYKDPKKAIKAMSFNGKFQVPADYEDGFRKAELTFLHHRVFCPIKKEMVFLNQLDHGMHEENMPFLGAHVEPGTAVDVARGHLNPKTKRPFEPVLPKMPHTSFRRGPQPTAAFSTQLKPSKSIESFFKHRQPLAELDPNSLTPSPSQLRIIETNRNASWEPNMVRSAPQLRTIHNRVYIDSPNPSSTGERNAFLVKAGTVSQYKPPKRQRLCSSSRDVSPSEEIKQSPFFSSKAHDMSPLLQKTSRQRKSKKSEFDIWSDDSVEQVMLSLETTERSEEAHLVEIGQDESQPPPVGQNANTDHNNIDFVPLSSPTRHQGDTEDSQSGHKTGEAESTKIDSSENAVLVQMKQIDPNDAPKEFEDLLEYHVEQQNESIRKKQLAQTFARQSSQKQEAALKSLASSASPTTVEDETHGLEPALDQTENAASAIFDCQQSPDKPLIQTFIYQSPERQAFALESLQGSNTTTQRLHLPSKISSIIRKTMGSVAKPQTLYSQPRGSEDALVPNSEDEASEAEDGDLKPAFDLKSFAYVS